MFSLRKVWPKGSTWTMNPIPGCKDTGGRARHCGGVSQNVPWFHRGSVRFRKKPKSSQLPPLSNLDQPRWTMDSRFRIHLNWECVIHQHHHRTYCREPTFTPAPAADKFWRYADGTSPGTAWSCRVWREVVTWIQTCFLFHKNWLRCEFYAGSLAMEVATASEMSQRNQMLHVP